MSVSSSLRISEQLWVPAYMPTMATRVVVSVWKKSGSVFTPDTPLGHHYLDLAKIRKCRNVRELRKDLEKEQQFVWLNLYGAAVKGVKQRNKTAILMNTLSDHASTYRGRVLINIRALLRPPPDFNNVPVRKSLPWSVKADLVTPSTALYTLRAYVVQVTPFGQETRHRVHSPIPVE